MVARCIDARKGANHANRRKARHRVTVWLVAQDAALGAATGAILLPTAANRSAADLPHLSTMADLSRHLLIDSVSGTVLCASQCYLVNDDSLSVQEWDDMESMSDSEVGSLAINHGRKLSDVVTLRAVLPGESA
jgi:hypothetical protein